MSYRNKYDRPKITNNIYSTLPMNEFVAGDFSNAWEIVEQYNLLIQKCLTEASKKILWKKTIEQTISESLKSLLKETEKLKNKRASVLDKLKLFDQLKTQLKDEKKWNKKWEIIYIKLEEFNFDTEEFESFIEKIKQGNEEDYKKWEETITMFLGSENYKKIKEWGTIKGNKVISLKETSDKITWELDHPENEYNLEKSIVKVRGWTVGAELKKQIRDNVNEQLGKKNKFGSASEDPRDLKTIYMETLTYKIIINKNTGYRLRSELIKRHDDKLWLRNYVRNIYLYLALKETQLIDKGGGKENATINEEEQSINEDINKLGEMWNNRYLGIEVESSNLEKVLISLLKQMDAKEKKMIKEKLKDSVVFKRIEETLGEEKVTQLELFPL